MIEKINCMLANGYGIKKIRDPVRDISWIPVDWQEMHFQGIFNAGQVTKIFGDFVDTTFLNNFERLGIKDLLIYNPTPFFCYAVNANKSIAFLRWKYRIDIKLVFVELNQILAIESVA